MIRNDRKNDVIPVVLTDDLWYDTPTDLSRIIR